LPALNVLKEASHPENCDWAKGELKMVPARINSKLRIAFFIDAKKCKMFVLQNLSNSYCMKASTGAVFGGCFSFLLARPQFSKKNYQEGEMIMCKKQLNQHHQELWHYI